MLTNALSKHSSNTYFWLYLMSMPLYLLISISFFFLMCFMGVYHLVVFALLNRVIAEEDKTTSTRKGLMLSAVFSVLISYLSLNVGDAYSTLTSQEPKLILFLLFIQIIIVNIIIFRLLLESDIGRTIYDRKVKWTTGKSIVLSILIIVSIALPFLLIAYFYPRISLTIIQMRPFLLTVLFTLLGSAMVEEIIFRIYVPNAFNHYFYIENNNLRALVGFVVSTGFFIIVHAYQNMLDIRWLAIAIIISAFSYLSRQIVSIIPGIILHGILNALMQV